MFLVLALVLSGYVYEIADSTANSGYKCVAMVAIILVSITMIAESIKWMLIAVITLINSKP
jgi:hypothetical protein